MPKSPLKLVDAPAEYTYQRLADLANEVKRESDQTVSIATDTLEIARLQTELADLRERNAALEEKLRQSQADIDRLMSMHNEVVVELVITQRWAKAWKQAATVNWRARKKLQLQVAKTKG